MLTELKQTSEVFKQIPLSTITCALLLSTTLALSSPSGGVVKSGSANIVHADKTTNINQSSNSASINWNTFNIAKDESVNFNQPSSSSITLNRVIGTEKSIISGALNANGQVWILNSNGVLFGKTASINTSGLLATTKEISTDSFKSKDYTLQGNSINSVINDGSINIKSNGYVILAANEVQNSGVIKAIRGRVHLVGANSISINLNGNSLISLTVNKGVLDSLVKNSGDIYADGGEIYLSTNAKNELLKGVVNNTGLIEANSIDDLEGKTYNGKIELFAHGGTAEVGGVINAKDGFVETSGREFSILSDADINAGEWLIDPYYVNIDATLAGIIVTALASGDVIINAETGTHTPGTITGGTNDIGALGDARIEVNSAITWDTENNLNLVAPIVVVNATIENTNTTSGGVYFYEDTASLDASIPTAQTETAEVVFNTTGKVIINNLFQLQGIHTALSGKYELGSDIDASATSSWNSDNGWKPIGKDLTVKFTGVFDGKNHTISNLFINRESESNIGLFGYARDATIQNTGLVDVDITGKSFVGGLVGISYANIINSYATGDVVGLQDYVGGLVGGSYINASIFNSYATADVVGDYVVGGLLGNNSSSVIIDSYATGDVTGINRVGGLVGNHLNSTMIGSYATGDVTGSGEETGGLIGRSDGSSTIDSYATGDVSGVVNVGGLIGVNNNSSSIANSYATGDVTGSSIQVGGLVGYATSSSTITSSYATGDVSGVDNVGGLIGYISVTSSITNSYATGDVNGVNSVGGLAGYTSNDSSITNSYAIGTVVGTSDVGGLIGLSEGGSTTITNSFYNLDDNADESYNTSGTGKSLAQFKDIETFNADESSPWDISYTDDTTIPNLDSSYRYPILVKVDDTIYWKIYNGPDPIPTPGTSTDNIITPINNGSLTQVEIPSANNPTNNASLTIQAGAQSDISGDSNSHTASPSSNQATKTVTLSQRRTSGGTTKDIRTPISSDSMITLVNAGISLPDGVDQEFYTAAKQADEKNKK